jgi:hypothetical protein
MVAGAALNVAAGVGLLPTVTVTDCVTDPALLVAVSVYVVVVVGDTVRVPDAATVPMP